MALNDPDKETLAYMARGNSIKDIVDELAAICRKHEAHERALNPTSLNARHWAGDAEWLERVSFRYLIN